LNSTLLTLLGLVQHKHTILNNEFDICTFNVLEEIESLSQTQILHLMA